MISENLKQIFRTMKDPAVLVELFSSDATPADFSPTSVKCLKRYAAVGDFDEERGGIGMFGASYQRMVLNLGRASLSTTEKANTFSLTLSNLLNEISEFELNDEGGGFEGKVIVCRIVSRIQSVNLEDSRIVFAGRCEKPTSGTREKLTVSAKNVLGSLDVSVPRRKFTKDDLDGRHPDDENFEGFIFMPQYGSSPYSVREKRTSFFGKLFSLKHTVQKTLPWSSFSDLDSEKYLPEVVGRCQIIFTHIGYADIGEFIRMTSAACEGEIEDFFNVRSVSPGFNLTSSFEKKKGKKGLLNGIANPDWIASRIYSETAHILCEVSGSQVQTTDPAPDIVGGILGRLMPTPNESGVWNITKWCDDGAAQTRFFFTSPDYGKLDAAWIDDESAFESWQYNNEIIFDTANSDLLFVPDQERYAAGGDGYEYLFRSTGTVGVEYFKYLAGGRAVKDTFLLDPRGATYDEAENRAPIEPIDPTEPGPGGGEEPTLPSLVFYLRRRYVSNFVITEEIPLVDLFYKVIAPASRLYLTQGADGRVKIKNKKPVDWALGTAAFNAFGDTIALDDVSKWIADKSGYLLVDPNTANSEVREVSAANYATSQNSVDLLASSNIGVSGFSGGNGANLAATASLTINSRADDNFFSLDGIEISFTASEADTTATTAGFIYAAINAHPTLSRRFAAAWTPGANIVSIKAKFGAIILSSVLALIHAAPLGNPAAAPTLSAVSGGTLAAGTYRVAYSFANDRGQTLLSPYAEITISANQKINVAAIVSTGEVCWYVSPAADSAKVRFYKRNSGAALTINDLPRLSASVPPDFNRTGCEVMRVAAVFSDRGEERSNLTRSNVIDATFEWILGNREKTINQVEIAFRDSTQDFRLTRLILRDDLHIKKTGKISKLEINGQAIDSYHQAYRIASGELAEKRDADFFYKWTATREALLLEEDAVVCITDAGSGAVNLPVRIESIDFELNGFPRASFTARKYATTLYDDSVAERQIPIVVETGSAQARAAAEVHYAPTNFTPTRAFDADTANLGQVIDVVATLMDDLENKRI